MFKEVEYAGIKLKNPFVVASGPPATVERLVRAEDGRAAAVSVKLTFVKQPFYGRLRMYSKPGDASIVCHDRRLDMEEGFELVRQGKERTELKLFANITHPAEDLDGWVTLARGYEQAGADAIELNLICPNITFSERRMGRDTDKSHGAVIGQHPEIIETVVRAVRDAVKIPVFAKLTPNVNDITVTAKAAVRGGASGIVMAGGQSALPRVDIHGGGRPLGAYCCDGYSFGSMGGPGIIHQSFSRRHRPRGGRAQHRQQRPLHLGGRHHVPDWGATLVTACTVLMWEGFRPPNHRRRHGAVHGGEGLLLLGRHPRARPLPEARPRAGGCPRGGHRRASASRQSALAWRTATPSSGRQHAKVLLVRAPAEYVECARLGR